jgi:hypothetical protein
MEYDPKIGDWWFTLGTLLGQKDHDRLPPKKSTAPHPRVH